MATITLQEFADEMAKAAEEWPEKARKVVEDSAKAIRDTWRERWRGGDAPYLAASITYDVYSEGEIIRAEVGPDKALPQGALGNLVEFGSIHNPPHPGGLFALEKEEPNFVDHIATTIVKSFEGED